MDAERTEQCRTPSDRSQPEPRLPFQPAPGLTLRVVAAGTLAITTALVGVQALGWSPFDFELGAITAVVALLALVIAIAATRPGARTLGWCTLGATDFRCARVGAVGWRPRVARRPSARSAYRSGCRSIGGRVQWFLPLDWPSGVLWVALKPLEKDRLAWLERALVRAGLWSRCYSDAVRPARAYPRAD